MIVALEFFEGDGDREMNIIETNLEETNEIEYARNYYTFPEFFETALAIEGKDSRQKNGINMIKKKIKKFE